MNKVMLMGRLTKDPEIRYVQNGEGLCIARYTLAVNRRGKNDEADFINCTAFGKSAEFAEKYLKKGMKILVCGRIQTGSYDNKEGRKVYTTDVVVEEHEFAESKKDSNTTSSTPTQQGGYQQVPTQQGDYQQTPMQQGGYQQNSSQQGGYQQAPTQQGGYQQAPTQQGGYQQVPSQQGGYQQNPQGYQQPAPNYAPQQQGGYYRPANGEGFMNIPDGIDEELPFN